MNSKIKMLAEQSGVTNPFVQETMEHFAELLMKDCLNFCLNIQIGIDIDVWKESTKKDISRLTVEGLVEKIKERYTI